MYLVRYTGDTTNSGMLVENTLFFNEEAAKAFMQHDFEQVRDNEAKCGTPLPTETSEENDLSYTDISEKEIRVYRDEETMLWELIEIIPQDMPEDLKGNPTHPEPFTVEFFTSENGMEAEVSSVRLPAQKAKEIMVEGIRRLFANGSID